MDSVINFVLVFFSVLFIYSCDQRKSEHMHDANAPVQSEAMAEPGIIKITQAQFDASGFVNDTFSQRFFAETIEANGEIYLPKRNRAVVSTYFGGVVSNMKLIHGQWVRKNQHLFSLTNPDLIDLQQEYIELNEEIPYLNSEYERLKKLSSENIAPVKNFLKTKAEYNMARTRRSALKKKAELIGLEPEQFQIDSLVTAVKISSPISGYLSEINVVQGVYLNATDVAMEVSNVDHLHLELKVLEGTIPKLKRGQKVFFNIQGDVDRSCNASIHLVEQQVDENRMVNVHCHLEDQNDVQLVPGMFVNAIIEVNRNKQIALPLDAIVTKEGKAHILVQDTFDPLKYKIHGVEIGEMNSEYSEIVNIDPVLKNRTVLVKGAYYLLKDD